MLGNRLSLVCLTKFMNTGTLRMIYYVLFHGIIDYTIIAWGGAYKKLYLCYKSTN